MRGWQTWISLAASIWAFLGGLFTWGAGRLRSRGARARRLKALRRTAEDGAIALCVRVGGNSNPLPDVRSYLESAHPGIQTILFYQPSETVDLGDPAIGQRVIEDIREGLREYASGRLTEIHFFPAGMVVYPIVVAAIISNWAPVTVYHKHGLSYVPLYTLSQAWLNHGAREFESLGSWQVLPATAPT